MEEKKYIIDVILHHFLGIGDYSVCTDSKETGYTFELPNKNVLAFPDLFFLNEEKGSYLREEKLPKSTEYRKCEFSVEKDIPVFFGDGSINRKKRGEKTSLFCNIDIIASIFFMLTRWEECLVSKKDKHGRVSAKSSVAHKFGFLKRPVVNEYIEMFWKLLTFLGYSGTRKAREYKIIPTHDIDVINYPVDPKTIIGDLLKRQSFISFRKRLNARIKGINPFDSFGWIMDCVEKHNVQARFYFMNGGTSSFDKRYTVGNRFILDRIREIASRNHIVGFHPSYSSFGDSEQWRYEKEEMENALGFPVEYGRQHYLRFSVPDTWQVWDDNNMKEDQTVCFHDEPGFRCGTGDSFPVFNVKTKERLNLFETPLIVMDGTIAGYQKITDLTEIEEVFFYFKNTSEKYRMRYTILFHNNRLSDYLFQKWTYLFEKLIKL